MSESTYPLRVYVIEPDGKHGEPIEISSERQLYGPGMSALVSRALAAKHELIATDHADVTVLHVKDGVILWPPAGARVPSEKPRE